MPALALLHAALMESAEERPRACEVTRGTGVRRGPTAGHLTRSVGEPLIFAPSVRQGVLIGERHGWTSPVNSWSDSHSC